nr:MAG TPA: hypothetical protein [Bacteriophage sp.]
MGQFVRIRSLGFPQQMILGRGRSWMPLNGQIRRRQSGSMRNVRLKSSGGW